MAWAYYYYGNYVDDVGISCSYIACWCHDQIEEMHDQGPNTPTGPSLTLTPCKVHIQVWLSTDSIILFPCGSIEQEYGMGLYYYMGIFR